MKTLYQVAGFLVLFPAILSLGCSGNHYDIELEPTEAGLQRSLTCWRADNSNPDNVGGFSAQELMHLADTYSVAVGQPVEGKHNFTKLFAEAMPNDIGGSGSFRRWETSLGTLSIYVERFRGDDDLLTEMEARLMAIDTFADLLRGWLTSELEGEQGVEQLSNFLNINLRRDLKNLCLYAWIPELVPQQDNLEQVLGECLLRAGHYLVERSYFSIEDIPSIARAIEEQEATGHSQKLLLIVQRLVATKMGVDTETGMPKCLNFLAHELAIRKSIENYLSSSDQYANLLKQWEEASDLDEDQKPGPMDVISDLVMRAFFPDLVLFARSDRLTVRLNITQPPFLTNGHWDHDNHRLTWTRAMLGSDAETFEYPSFLFALWTDPNNEAQTDHFGEIILDREALAKYCVWHWGLSDGEARQWESFLSDNAGQAGFLEQLTSFRFSREPPATDRDLNADDDLAATARTLIEEALAEQ